LASSQNGIYFSSEAILSSANTQVDDDSSENFSQAKFSRNLVKNIGKNLPKAQVVDTYETQKNSEDDNNFPKSNRRQDFDISNRPGGNSLKELA